jgi:hypothetical protein
MVTDNAAQEHIAVEEEEVIVMNWQSDGSNSDGSKYNGSPRSWHGLEDELGHLLERGGGSKRFR